MSVEKLWQFRVSGFRENQRSPERLLGLLECGVLGLLMHRLPPRGAESQLPQLHIPGEKARHTTQTARNVMMPCKPSRLMFAPSPGRACLSIGFRCRCRAGRFLQFVAKCCRRQRHISLGPSRSKGPRHGRATLRGMQITAVFALACRRTRTHSRALDSLLQLLATRPVLKLI